MPTRPRSMIAFADVARRCGTTEAELVELTEHFALNDAHLDRDG